VAWILVAFMSDEQAAAEDLRAASKAGFRPKYTTAQARRFRRRIEEDDSVIDLRDCPVAAVRSSWQWTKNVFCLRSQSHKVQNDEVDSILNSP
jgi:hypothetical protein